MFLFDAHMNTHYVTFDVWLQNLTQFAFKTFLAQIMLFDGLEELLAHILFGLEEHIANIFVGLKELLAHKSVGLKDEQVSNSENQDASLKQDTTELRKWRTTLKCKLQMKLCRNIKV